jgi:antitoxin component of RelBE/YafQ-DinJ toxin-antitoxin module
MLTRKIFNVSTLCIALAGAMLSSHVLAGDASDRWNRSDAKQQFIEAKAVELGIDISTQEGRDELRATLTAERVVQAAELGFDITTQEGREAFHDARKEERQEQRIARAAELGFDVTTDEGREAFQAARKALREERREQFASLSDEERDALKEELQGLTREERHELLDERFAG